jgi:hypothetical protein
MEAALRRSIVAEREALGDGLGATEGGIPRSSRKVVRPEPRRHTCATGFAIRSVCGLSGIKGTCLQGGFHPVAEPSLKQLGGLHEDD